VYNLNRTLQQQTKINEVSVDTVIFTVRNKELMVLLIKRGHEPFKDMWAVPGGFLRISETLEDSSRRVLYERTHVENVYLEQLYCFSNPNRYPNARVITVTYFALIGSHNLKLSHDPGIDIKGLKWQSVYNLPPLAFDHDMIIKFALRRLREKLEFSNIAFQLLPAKFTLTELQKVYEIIQNKPLDKRNFRKKMISLGILEELEEFTKSTSKRPARLYSFKVLEDEDAMDEKRLASF
jgi:8-oxo-dGTP diphosphatase